MPIIHSLRNTGLQVNIVSQIEIELTHQSTAKIIPDSRLSREIIGSVQHSDGHPTVYKAAQPDLISSSLGILQQTRSNCCDKQWHVLHVISMTALGTVKGRELLCGESLSQILVV